MTTLLDPAVLKEIEKGPQFELGVPLIGQWREWATRIALMQAEATAREIDAAISEAANKYASVPAENYYLHGLWKARELLRALAAEIENAAPK